MKVLDFKLWFSAHWAIKLKRDKRFIQVIGVFSRNYRHKAGSGRRSRSSLDCESFKYNYTLRFFSFAFVLLKNTIHIEKWQCVFIFNRLLFHFNDFQKHFLFVVSRPNRVGYKTGEIQQPTISLNICRLHDEWMRRWGHFLCDGGWRSIVNSIQHAQVMVYFISKGKCYILVDLTWKVVIYLIETCVW